MSALLGLVGQLLVAALPLFTAWLAGRKQEQYNAVRGVADAKTAELAAAIQRPSNINDAVGRL